MAPAPAATTPPATPRNRRRDSAVGPAATGVCSGEPASAAGAAGRPTTRAVSSAAAQTRATAISAVLNVSGYPAVNVTTRPASAA